MNVRAAQLGEVAEVGAGQGAPQDRRAFTKDGHVFIRAGSLEALCDGDGDSGLERIDDKAAANHGLRLYSANTVVFAKSGMSATKNRIYRLRRAAYIVNHLATIVPNEGLDATYLRYWLEHFNPTRLIQDISYPSISLEAIETVAIPLPDLSEQRQIAGRLEQADRLRRTRRSALKLTDTFLPAAFLELFGDPRQNPNKWPEQTLSAVCVKFSDGPFGSNLKTSDYRLSGVRVVRLQNIGVGEFLDDDKAFVSKEHFAALQKHECIPGDVLIGTMGDPNVRACIQPTHIPIALNKADCIQARPDPKHLNALYLQALLNIPSTLHLVPGMVHGQTRGRVSMGELARLPIPVPPLPLQHKFAALVERVERLRAMQREALRQAEHLLSSLLDRAFKY